MRAMNERADVALQAAVLAHGIAELQPFVEGNKRTAELAFVTFLEENGYLLTASQPERAGWIEELSQGIPPERLVEHIRAAIVPAHRE